VDKATGRALLRFARHLYPHTPWKTPVYAMVVKALDKGPRIQARRSFSSDASRRPRPRCRRRLDGEEPDRQLLASKRSRNSVLRQVAGTCVTAALRQSWLHAPLRLRGQLLGEGGYLQQRASTTSMAARPAGQRQPTCSRPAPDHRRSNMATYEMNDDSVGSRHRKRRRGRHPGDELCQKASRSCCSRRQARIEGHLRERRVGLVRPASPGRTSAPRRNLARGAGLPELRPGPAGRRRAHHPLAGASLRFQRNEFKALTTLRAQSAGKPARLAAHLR